MGLCGIEAREGPRGWRWGSLRKLQRAASAALTKRAGGKLAFVVLLRSDFRRLRFLLVVHVLSVLLLSTQGL